MRIVLATGNAGKLREFQAMCDESIVPYTELCEPFEIVEDGRSFAQNAWIKARAVADKLGNDTIVIADDSGISVPLLGGEPGIFSARYAGEGASDKDNLCKLIEAIRSKGVAQTPAYYTAAIAIASPFGAYTVHGWMHGTVIAEARGEKGFGYDPMFIPEGYDKTLGELDDAIKSQLSHRAKALALAKPIIRMVYNKK